MAGLPPLNMSDDPLGIPAGGAGEGVGLSQMGLNDLKLHLTDQPVMQMPPHLLNMKDQIAQQYQLKNGYEAYFSGDNIGKSAAEIAQAQRDEHLAEKAMQIAESGIGMNDEEFNQLVSGMIGEAGAMPRYQEPARVAPSREMLAASAISALLSPKTAFRSMAAPYEWANEEHDRAVAEANRTLQQDVLGWRSRLEAKKLAVTEQNRRDLEDARLRNDALDRASREKIAAGRQESQAERDAKRILNDPKSTVVARRQALADLAGTGYMIQPELQKQYLESTYYEDNQKSLKENRDASTARITRQTARYDLLDEKTKSEIDNLKKRGKVLDADHARLLKVIEHFDKDKALKAYQVYSNVALAKSRLAEMQKRTGLQAKSLQLQARQQYVSALGDAARLAKEQVGSLQTHLGQLGTGMQIMASEGRQNSPEYQDAQDAYNNAWTRLYGDGKNAGLAQMAETIRTQFETANSQRAPGDVLRANLSGLAKTAASIAERYGVPPSLFVSLIQAESNFNPNAKSKKGALGLGQLMPGTARQYGLSPEEAINNPERNMHAAAQHLAALLKSFDGDVDKALAAYNAGSGNVKKYGGIPPFKETQEYVRRVKAMVESLQKGTAKVGGAKVGRQAGKPASGKPGYSNTTKSGVQWSLED